MRLAFITVLLALCAQGYTQTPIGGVISTNTTLTSAGSPYVVTSNILVTNGTTLTIDPGVEVRFLDSLYLQIDGTIRAIGTSQSPILFQLDPSCSIGWGGIRIMNGSTDYDTLTGAGCVIAHAIFTESVPVPINLSYYTGLIHCLQSSPLLDHLDISCCSSGLFFDQSSAILSNSIIHDNNYLTVFVCPFLPESPFQKVTIRDNNFYNNFFINNIGSVFFDLLGPARITGNCFDYVQADMVMRVRTNNIQVTYNRISNCYGVAVGLMGGTDTSQVISHNEFTNNRIHFVFPSCVRYPEITGNNINSFMQKAVVCTTYYYPFIQDNCPQTSNSSFVYNMQGNYWGNLTTPALIAAAVQDFDDDFQNLIDIDYSNALPSPVLLPAPACNNIGLNCSTLTVQQPAVDPAALYLWPNPATGENLNVRTGGNSNVHYRVVNSSGQTVLEADVYCNTGQFTLNTAMLAQGFYALVVTDETGVTRTADFVKAE